MFEYYNDLFTLDDGDNVDAWVAGGGVAWIEGALDDPESLVVPILMDAILLVESYRGARHQITFLDDLSGSVDALLRELTIVEKSKLWAAE